MKVQIRASQVVLASSNPGKLQEIGAMLSDLDMEVLPQSRFGISGVAETAPTFVENALLKARDACALSGRPAIADDSGLEVDALHGAPGVRSARYAGETASDQANLYKLLREMTDVPQAKRGCRFHCLMVFLAHRNDPTPIICHGVWEGRVLSAPRGTNGFGYDPVFFVPEEGCSSAELAPEVKNRLSHRGQAMGQLLARLA